MADVEEEDALPPIWVKRRSRRRQAQVYYFNTLTGESSWTHPAKHEDCGGGAGRERQQSLTLDKRSASDSDDEQPFRGAAKKLMKSIERPCREALGKQIGKDINERCSLNVNMKHYSSLQGDGHAKCLHAGSVHSILKDGKGKSEDVNSENLDLNVPKLCKKSGARRCSVSPSVCSLGYKDEKSEGEPKSCQKLDTRKCSVSSCLHAEEKREAKPEFCKRLVAKRKYSTSSSPHPEKPNETKRKNTQSLLSNICDTYSDKSLDKETCSKDSAIEYPLKPNMVTVEASQQKGNDVSCMDKKTSSENCMGEAIRKDIHDNQIKQRDSNQGEQKGGNQVEQKESKIQQIPSIDLKNKDVGAVGDKGEASEKCKPTLESKFRLEKYNGKIITVGKITKPSKSPRVSFKIEKKKEMVTKLSPVFKEKDVVETKPAFKISKKKFLPVGQLKGKGENISERKAELIGKALATLSQEEYKELIGSERQKNSVNETERLYSSCDINEYVTRVKEMDPVSQITEARTQEKSVCDHTYEYNSCLDSYRKELTKSEKEVSVSKKKNIFKETRHEPREKKVRMSHSSKSSSSESSHSRSSQKKSSSRRSSPRRSSHRKSSPDRCSSSKKYDIKTSTCMEERDSCQPKEMVLHLPVEMSLQSSTQELQFSSRLQSSCGYENENFTEAMEVETTEIISEITSFRDTAPTLDEKIEHWNPEAAKTLEKSNEVVSSLTLGTEGLKPIFFVVDTNILIEDLTYIEKLCQFSFHGRELIIVVPYGAIQELDGLKQSNKVGLQSQKAIRWCHQKFLAKDKRVIGQTFVQYKQAAEIFEGQSGDDRMRDCALQLKQMGVDVVLLSNDINLLNKALLAGLDVSNLDSLKEKITDSIKSLATDEVNKPSFHSKLTADAGGLKEAKPVHSLAMNVQTLDKEERKNADIVDKLKEMLKGTLGKILEYYMKEMFESLWLQIVLVKPPWTLKDIFLCWEKHWLAVFIDPFPSQVNTWVKETAVLCKKNKLTTSEVKRLLTLVENLYKVFRVTCESLVVDPPSDLDTSHLNSNSSESSVLSVTSDSLLQEQSKNESSKSLISIEKEVTTPQTEVKVTQQPLPTPLPVSRGTENGTLNLQEMIKRVGQCMEQYMTNIIDSVAKSVSMQSEEPPPFSLTSLQNLGQSIKTFGSVIVECLHEASDEVIIKLGTYLTEFWVDANLPCPGLPFTSTDIQEFLSLPCGRNYLEEVTKELERFYHALESTYQRVTEGNQ